MAADLNVPVLVLSQKVPHTPTEGTFATGFKEFEAVQKSYPKTKFIGHAYAFWANISAHYNNESDHPTGKIKPGGITDKLLGDYLNHFANSGNNALSRDPEFTQGFLKRHQSKLIFGSDCACTEQAARWMHSATPVLMRDHGQELASYPWPGNVRELQNVIERAVVPTKDETLRFGLQQAAAPSAVGTEHQAPVSTYRQLLEHERRNIVETLQKSGGKVYGTNGAAELLGMRPTTLTSKLVA